MCMYDAIGGTTKVAASMMTFSFHPGSRINDGSGSSGPSL